MSAIRSRATWAVLPRARADRDGPGRPDGDRCADHADGGERAQRHLARAPAAPAGAARAGVLGDADLRAGADRRQPVDQFLPDLGLGRLRPAPCRSASACWSAWCRCCCRRWPSPSSTPRCPMPTWTGATPSSPGWWRRWPSNWPARLRLLHHPYPDLYGGLRHLRRAADLPAVDLPELAGDLAGRHHRRQPAGDPPGPLARRSFAGSEFFDALGVLYLLYKARDEVPRSVGELDWAAAAGGGRLPGGAAGQAQGHAPGGPAAAGKRAGALGLAVRSEPGGAAHAAQPTGAQPAAPGAHRAGAAAAGRR